MEQHLLCTQVKTGLLMSRGERRGGGGGTYTFRVAGSVPLSGGDCAAEAAVTAAAAFSEDLAFSPD